LYKEVAELAFEATLKILCHYLSRYLEHGISGFGEMLPYENKVTSIIPKKDKWDNLLGIDCEIKENEAKMREDMMGCRRNAGSFRIKNKTYDNDCYPGMAIHEMGTARMGNDPKTSV
jgi:choline dehydrogenase-like flavoprotein